MIPMLCTANTYWNFPLISGTLPLTRVTLFLDIEHKMFITFITLVGFFTGMCTNVLGQVPAIFHFICTPIALDVILSVCMFMLFQIVQVCGLLATIWKTTHMRFRFEVTLPMVL